MGIMATICLIAMIFGLPILLGIVMGNFVGHSTYNRWVTASLATVVGSIGIYGILLIVMAFIEAWSIDPQV